jgi:hypothetical protein
MGHFSIQVTVDIDGHLVPDRQAVDRLDDVPVEKDSHGIGKRE